MFSDKNWQNFVNTHYESVKAFYSKYFGILLFVSWMTWKNQKKCINEVYWFHICWSLSRKYCNFRIHIYYWFIGQEEFPVLLKNVGNFFKFMILMVNYCVKLKIIIINLETSATIIVFLVICEQSTCSYQNSTVTVSLRARFTSKIVGRRLCGHSSLEPGTLKFCRIDFLFQEISYHPESSRGPILVYSFRMASSIFSRLIALRNSDVELQWEPTIWNNRPNDLERNWGHQQTNLLSRPLNILLEAPSRCLIWQDATLFSIHNKRDWDL